MVSLAMLGSRRRWAPTSFVRRHLLGGKKVALGGCADVAKNTAEMTALRGQKCISQQKQLGTIPPDLDEGNRSRFSFIIYLIASLSHFGTLKIDCPKMGRSTVLKSHHGYTKADARLGLFAPACICACFLSLWGGVRTHSVFERYFRD